MEKELTNFQENDYDEIPDKVSQEEEEVDEIVDAKGNIKEVVGNRLSRKVYLLKTTDKTAWWVVHRVHMVHTVLTRLRYYRIRYE